MIFPDLDSDSSKVALLKIQAFLFFKYQSEAGNEFPSVDMFKMGVQYSMQHFYLLKRQGQSPKWPNFLAIQIYLEEKLQHLFFSESAYLSDAKCRSKLADLEKYRCSIFRLGSFDTSFLVMPLFGVCPSHKNVLFRREIFRLVFQCKSNF